MLQELLKKNLIFKLVVGLLLISVGANKPAYSYYDDLPIDDIPRPGGVLELSRIIDQAIQENRERMERMRREFDEWREQRKEQFNAGFMPGHKIEVIKEGATLLEERLKSIRGAKESIYLSTFIFDKDETARKIIGALCKKSKEGLDVRLLVDSFGAKPFYNKYAEWMRQECHAGVMRFNPPHWGLNKIAYVIHEKLIIIDGRIVHMGGNGVQNSYHHVAPAHKFFHDIDLKIEGPVACFFQRQFVQTYQESIRWDSPINIDGSGGRSLNYEEYLFGPRRYVECDLEQAPAGDASIHPVYANPLFSKEKPIFESYLNAMLSVEDGSEIKLYAPYFVPHDRFVAALLWAASRGMKVTVMTNSIESNDEGTATLIGMVYKIGKLIKAGVKIKHWKGPMTLHRKAGIYGGKYAYVGSDNLDTRGHFYSSESISFTSHPQTVLEVNELFEEDLKNTFDITPEYIQKILETAGKLKKWAIRRILMDYL